MGEGQRRCAVALAVASLAAPAVARAAEPDLPPAVDARADDVSLDARERELLLKGHVRVDSPPFYLTSDELLIRRTRLGADVEGKGKVAFCPCLGTPLAVGFDRATVAPPGDLFLEDPTLRVYDVPVLWLPFFWLRSPGRIGLLAPDVQYRGKDGMFLGDGVHLPLVRGDTENGVDVRAGAYTAGGLAVDVQARTPMTLTHVRWDRLHGDDGVLVDARGGFDVSRSQESVHALAWDVDAIRGGRGVLATSDLEAASRVYDRATAETSWRSGPFTLASGVRSVSARGTGVLDVGAAGPMVAARASEAIGGAGAFDATIDGGQLRGDALRALSYARAETGAMVATRIGGLGASASARGAGDVADDGARRGKDGVGALRAELALPLVRAYGAADETDPLLHRLEPRLAGGILGAHDEDVLGALPGRGAALVHGAAWYLGGSIYNALGRWGARQGNEVEASFGAIGDDSRARPVLRWRGATTTKYLGTAADAARVFPGMGPAGSVAVTRYRIGATDGVHLGVLVAVRDGVDPVAARVLTDAPLEPATGFLAREGWTGGSRLSIPWTRGVTTSMGADGDLSAKELLAARASIELRDRCGCLVVRAAGGHRLGRPGVDVGLTVDFVPPR